MAYIFLVADASVRIISVFIMGPKDKGRHEEEDSEPCAECNTEIFEGDQALQCDLCDKWFGHCCIKLSKSVYDRISKSKANEGIMWFCVNCRGSLPSMKNIMLKVNEMEKRHKEVCDKLLNLENGGLEEAVRKIMDKNDGARPDSLRSGNVNNVPDLVSEVIYEQEERASRVNNVICFGLKESVAPPWTKEGMMIIIES